MFKYHLQIFAILVVVIVTATAYAGESQPVVWILKTELVGEMNSMRAVARRMNAITYEIDLPQYLLEQERQLDDARAAQPGTVRKLNLDPTKLAEAMDLALGEHPAPRYIFNSLNRTAKVSFVAGLKRKLGAKVLTVNFFDPGSQHASFDVIFNSTHNEPVSSGNVIELPGIPSQFSGIDLSLYMKPSIGMDPSKKIMAVLIGGRSKAADLTPNDLKQLASILNWLGTHYDIQFVITNSRRTTAEAWSIFKNTLTATHSYIEWDSNAQSVNPLFYVMSQSDYFLVTGDSMSMLADAIVTRKPTFVYAPKGTLEERHQRFILEMSRDGRVRPLSPRMDSWSYVPVDAAKELADILIKKLDQCAELMRRSQ